MHYSTTFEPLLLTDYLCANFSFSEVKALLIEQPRKLDLIVWDLTLEQYQEQVKIAIKRIGSKQQ